MSLVVFVDKPYLVTPKKSLIQKSGIMGCVNQLTLRLTVIKKIDNKFQE